MEAIAAEYIRKGDAVLIRNGQAWRASRVCKTCILATHCIEQPMRRLLAHEDCVCLCHAVFSLPDDSDLSLILQKAKYTLSKLPEVLELTPNGINPGLRDIVTEQPSSGAYGGITRCNPWAGQSSVYTGNSWWNTQVIEITPNKEKSE